MLVSRYTVVTLVCKQGRERMGYLQCVRMEHPQWVWVSAFAGGHSPAC